MSVIEFLNKVLEKEGYEQNERNRIDLLAESREMLAELSSRHRWWNIWEHVVEIDGKFIAYRTASANRDESVYYDLGWEFDWDSVRFVERKTRMVEEVYYE